ncbi:DNA polymerase-1 [Agrococcus jejuensis]|uniref:DNA-directed DNA polymerase n=1 Tax=Agrococcus jejuensis TaxID=399736 RepID=A0A1G8GF61_9MICO|nr:DNA polymerase-1 [Agrococcus jejuensis]
MVPPSVGAVDAVIAPVGDAWEVAVVGDDGAVRDRRTIDDLPAAVAALEPERPRWVWQDSTRVAPVLLAAGVAVERARDLRLSHRILADAGRMPLDARWLRRLRAPDGALFSMDEAPEPVDALIAELARQEAAVGDDASLRLLLGAESTGALIAEELLHVGLPWSSAEHDRLLADALGPRPMAGRPALLQALADDVDRILGHRVSIDSAPELLRALRGAGLDVRSTSRWELREIDHPVVEPLIAYKRLYRLWTANGWQWADEWVRDGRFHAEYVPAGVVTGRWATAGGGAMQIAKQVRGAVVADPGWRLVVADAAQLEPRVLAAMARDEALAEAAVGDLYEGLVDDGVVESRPKAKVAMLGALYGGTSGDSGRLVPALRRAYPRAMRVVDDAATTGERGGVVRTWLGRTSAPMPPARSGIADRDAVSRERAWGRFTRNFVVQGSAAEWALCWMALLRRSLRAGGGELVYFLHDEVIVHAPAERAEAVADEIRAAAAGAGRMLFGSFPITFPVDARIVGDYGAAND